MVKLALALFLLLGLAAAQITCPCEPNTGASCTGIDETQPGLCLATTTACSGCVCTVGGS